MAFLLQSQEEKQLCALTAKDAITDIEQIAERFAELLLEAVDEKYARRKRLDRKTANTVKPKGD